MPRDSVEVGLYSSEDGVELLWSGETHGWCSLRRGDATLWHL